MPQYLISVGHDTDDAPTMENMDPAEIQPILEATGAFNDKLKAEGAFVFAGGLHPIQTATGVDNTGDEPILTDGPFVESKEYLGGFWIIEAADLDEAIAWAKEGSRACQGRVEVRAFQEVPG